MAQFNPDNDFSVSNDTEKLVSPSGFHSLLLCEHDGAKWERNGAKHPDLILYASIHFFVISSIEDVQLKFRVMWDDQILSFFLFKFS